ncbi:MAG: thioredoxin family protein [Ruminococcaceae bacterium]|nr:thioredoxin family protein [Oscillospiraceae bacterium]
MKKIEYFYLEHCPHCKNADRMIKELIEKRPEFADIEIAKIEERKSPLYAEKFDYFYVPSMFVDGVKCHEGVPSLEKIEAVLEKALED